MPGCRLLLRDLLDNVETVPIVGGLPVLSTDLQWGCLPVFVVGELAGLQLGPGGSNLAGARQGADIVATKLGVNQDADQGKIGGVFTNVFAALAMESDSTGSDTSDSESEGSEDREDQHVDRHAQCFLPKNHSGTGAAEPEQKQTVHLSDSTAARCCWDLAAQPSSLSRPAKPRHLTFDFN